MGHTVAVQWLFDVCILLAAWPTAKTDASWAAPAFVPPGASYQVLPCLRGTHAPAAWGIQQRTNKNSTTLTAGLMAPHAGLPAVQLV